MSNPRQQPTQADDATLVASWSDSFAALGRPAPLAVRLELQIAWSESHRRYHDMRHLRECMALWSTWKDATERPAEVALALWFHDAVYNPQDVDNELKSASWAARALSSAGVADATVQRVYDLIMATCHDAPVSGRDAELLLDIDLAILGAPAGRFTEYDRDIRQEHAFVPWGKYSKGRKAVLGAFLQRSPLYRTAAARELEPQARVNLQTALARLEQ